MVWEIPSIHTPVNGRRERNITSIGPLNYESYFTINCEWVGHYINKDTAGNTYYDPFLYGDTDGINPDYVKDESALAGDLATLTVGSDDTTDVWLFTRSLNALSAGRELYGGTSPSRHQLYETDFSVESSNAFWTDWDTSTTRDFSDLVWTTPAIAQFIDTFKGNPDSGNRLRSNELDYSIAQTSYGTLTVSYNGSTATVNFGGFWSHASIIRVANPSHPNYDLFMPIEMYEAFVNMRTLFEAIGGSMSWLDTWDGVKVNANISTDYFGGTKSGVNMATLAAFFTGHAEYRPLYRLNALTCIYPTSGEAYTQKSPYLFHEIGTNWYLNGVPIFDKETDIDDLPFKTPGVSSLISAGEKFYPLAAMMREDMDVVLAATKMPRDIEDTSSPFNNGSNLLNYLINGMTRPVIKTSHCLIGSDEKIYEFHDARIALGDGGFALSSASLLWSWREYLPPIAWYSFSVAAPDNKTAIYGGKYIVGTTLYETEDIQDQTAEPADTSSSGANDIYSWSDSTTYTYDAPEAIYRCGGLFVSLRTKTTTQNHTETFINPTGGQEAPGHDLTATLTNTSNSSVSTEAHFQNGSSVEVELDEDQSSVDVSYSRTITNPVPDIDGNVTYSAWTETSRITITHVEDYYTDQYDARDCSTTEYQIETNHTGTRIYNSTIGGVDTSPLDDQSISDVIELPTEPSWGIVDHFYSSVYINNVDFVHDVDSGQDYAIVYHTLEMRKTSDNSVIESWAIGTPPNTKIINQYWGGPTGNGVFTYEYGYFIFDHAPYYTEPYHYILKWTRTGLSAGTGEISILTYKGVNGYSDVYPQTIPTSGWHLYSSARPYGIKIDRTATDADRIEGVTLNATPYGAYVNANRNCYFDGRSQNQVRIQMGAAAELLIPNLTYAMPHTAGRSLRGNTITLDTDSAGNQWVKFEPVVPGIDEVYITLITGEIVMTVVTVMGATYITDYGTSMSSSYKTWRSYDNRVNYLRHPRMPASDSSLPYAEHTSTGTTITFRDFVSVKPTDDYSLWVGHNQWPQWDTNTDGYYDYTLTKNKLLADGLDIEDGTLVGGTEVVLTTTSGLPFGLAMVIAGNGVTESYRQVFDDRGALYCVDEDDPTEWRLRPELIPCKSIQFLYIDIESQEKRVTEVIPVTY